MPNRPNKINCWEFQVHLLSSRRHPAPTRAAASALLVLTCPVVALVVGLVGLLTVAVFSLLTTLPMVSVFVDEDISSSSCPAADPANLSHKRKLPLFNPSKHSSRLSSLLSLSSSRKSPPTCTISLECATINVPCHSAESDAVLADILPSDVNAIPFPSSDSDGDCPQLDAVKVRRRSIQATPRSSLSEEQIRSRKNSLERTRKDSFERTRKSSVSKRKSGRRALVHHTLLAPASHLPAPAPRKRLPHMKQSDLRFMTVVRRSVQVGLDERMVDQESDLQEQDRLFVLRLVEHLAERGVRDDIDATAPPVLTPSQLVAIVTLRRRDAAAARSTNASARTAPARRRSPLASSP